MDAVGHMPDRNLLLGHPRPDGLPHLTGNAPVDGADPVGLTGKAKGQNGHAERLFFRVRPGAAELEQFVKADVTVADVVCEILLHQLGVKGIVPRRHRRVRGENAAGGHRLQGLDEGKLLLGNQHPDPLQPQEGCVAFIHVKHGGLDSHGIQGLHPANAQHDLLADPHVMVPAVQLVGDIPVIGRVGRKIRIQEEEPRQTDPHLPNLGFDLAPRHVEFDHHGSFAVSRQGFTHRQVMKDVIDDVGLLPSVPVDLLREITEAVEQANRHKRQAEITGRFAMIPGQDAETAGVDRQRLVETKLGGKISHQGLILLFLG